MTGRLAWALTEIVTDVSSFTSLSDDLLEAQYALQAPPLSRLSLSKVETQISTAYTSCKRDSRRRRKGGRVGYLESSLPPDNGETRE